MQKISSDANNTFRMPYCLKLSHWKFLEERSSRFFLKTKERCFRWHHKWEVIQSKVTIVEKRGKEIIRTLNTILIIIVVLHSIK